VNVSGGWIACVCVINRSLNKGGDMNKVFLVCILVLFFTPPLFAQSVDTAWVRRYDGPASSADEGKAIAVDNSGNIYVTGLSSSEGSHDDYATIKYYPNGDTAWVRRYNGPINASDWPSAIAVDGYGNVYVTGGSPGEGSDNDFATIKYYPDGDTAWVRRYNGPANGHDWAYALSVDDSGCVYVTGHSYGIGDSGDYATIKYYPDGATAWEKRYSGAGNGIDLAYAIAVDGSGSVYVTGQSHGGASDYDIATIKYNSNGDTAWVRRYNGVGDSADIGFRITVDGSGNVYVGGTSTGNGTGLDYVTIKYYPNGDRAWVREYNGSGNGFDGVLGLEVDNTGNVYATGQSVGASSNDIVTIKYYPNGDTAWLRTYDRPGCGDNAFDLAIDNSGNTYITGFSQCRSDSIKWDYVTIKYDLNGNLLWDMIYDGPASDNDRAYAIALDASDCFGNVFVTGGSYDGSENDILTIKYAQFECGDANGDCNVSLSDIVYLISYLFKGGSVPLPIQGAGDANCDGNVSLSDIVYLINYLFKGGAPPCC
jgi:hypothetical protein